MHALIKGLTEALKQSVKLPNKKATFALNRIGMDTAVIYLFIIIAIASIPNLIEQLLTTEFSAQIHPFFLAIYFFIFNYLVLLVMIFSLLSLFAYVMTVIAKILQRKLLFSILWKMSAFALTIPLIVFTVLSYFFPLTYIFVTIALVYMTFVLVKIILIYPKRRS